jgi:transcriptional regulator with XRE-family HTH domain
MNKARHDPEELRRLLALRKAKNLTFKQLAVQSGIPIHVLHHRAHRDDHAAQVKANEAAGFVELVPVPAEGLASHPSGIELLLERGLRVRLERDFDEATLARLLATVPC